MHRNVLVTGANGTVGSRLALTLAKAPDLRVHALVRDRERATVLAHAGIELREGSFEDESSLAAAMAGVDTLALITATGARAAEQAAAALSSAGAAGVRKVVRLSAIKASLDGPTDNTRQHGRTEGALRESGLTWVALRPQFFMQNLLGSLPTVVADGKLYSGVGEGRVAMIDTRDVADCLERAVLSADFDGQALELTGPTSVSHAEVVAAFGSALGRAVEYVAVTPEQSAEALRSFGADDWMVALMRDYMRAYREGFGDFVSDAVKRITGHEARSIDVFAREVFAPAAIDAAKTRA